MTNNYCAAPWRGLHIQVDGGISTCCAGGFKLGNINNDTIESALSSDKIKAVRESIKNGHLPKDYCGTCINAKTKGLRNEQDWHNSCNEDFEIDHANDEYQYPVIFDARWNNTCNSTCVYCNPRFSSKWASILNSHEQKPNKDNKDKIKTFFLERGNRLKTVAMVGGEPLLINENSDLLDFVPKHVKIDIITNFSTDVTKSKVFEKLLQRQKVNWHISLENIGERYEYVRQGSKWQTFIENLETLGKEVRNPPEKNDHEIQFMSMFHLLNATHLCEFKDFAKEALSFFPYKFDKRNPHSKNIEIVWQNYQAPIELVPENYGADVSKKIVAEIEKYLSIDSTPIEQTYFQPKIKSFNNVSTYTEDTTKKKFAGFIDQNEKLFKNTNKFHKLWPELSFLID